MKILQRSGINLLEDNLITTGPAMEACATKVLEIEGLKISMASMAITD